MMESERITDDLVPSAYSKEYRDLMFQFDLLSAMSGWDDSVLDFLEDTLPKEN